MRRSGTRGTARRAGRDRDAGEIELVQHRFPVDVLEAGVHETRDAAVAPSAQPRAGHYRFESGEQTGELRTPGGELDDLLDDKVVARMGQGRQTPVEAVEEARPNPLPPAYEAHR